MIPSDLIYAFPPAAILGLAVFMIGFAFWHLHVFRQRALAKFATLEVLRSVVVPISPGIYWTKSACTAIAWLCAVAALMGPQGNGKYLEEAQNREHPSFANVRKRVHDLILLIDVSASMAVPDGRGGATRLDEAKDIADQIISHLQGESAALYTFTSQVIEQSPMTMDYLYVRLVLRQIKINEGSVPGTDLTVALEEMHKRYWLRPTSKPRTLVVFTDGGDTLLESLPQKDKEQRIQAILAPLAHVQDFNLRIFTVGVGSQKGGHVPDVTFKGQPVQSSLEDDILRKIARRGKGYYYNANEINSVQLAADIIKDMNEQEAFTDESLRIPLSNASLKIYEEYYQIPLGLAIVLLTFVLLCPMNWSTSKQWNLFF
jgi:Ca-activated chloride channel homolog